MLFCLVVHSGFLKIWKAGAPVNLEDYVAQALVTSRQGVRIFEFFGGLFKIHELADSFCDPKENDKQYA